MSSFQKTIRLPRLAVSVTLISLVVLVALVSGQLHARPAQVTLVRCDPVSVATPIGETLSFSIYVENVVDLYAGDVQMSFDPNTAQVVDANPNRGGTQIEILDEFLAPDFVVRDRADNVAGTIWYANTQIHPSEPVSGSGPLAKVTMQSLRPGNVNVVITSQELNMIGGSAIPATTINCRISFFDPNATSITYMPIIISP